MCLCGGHWSVCEVILLPCVVTMMRVLLFVCDVSMLRECGSARRYSNAGVGDEGSEVSVSAGHEYMGGTDGSDCVCSADDVLGMRGIGEVCEMCMYLAWAVSG